MCKNKITGDSLTRWKDRVSVLIDKYEAHASERTVLGSPLIVTQAVVGSSPIELAGEAQSGYCTLVDR